MKTAQKPLKTGRYSSPKILPTGSIFQKSAGTSTEMRWMRSSRIFKSKSSLSLCGQKWSDRGRRRSSLSLKKTSSIKKRPKPHTLPNSPNLKPFLPSTKKPEFSPPFPVKSQQGFSPTKCSFQICPDPGLFRRNRNFYE